MRSLDETDREILRLLVADGRRPYSDIADHVELSAPAVADRIDRLREAGVVQGFTVRLDGRALSRGLETLVTIRTDPADAAAVYEALAKYEGVEHAFLTADGEVTATIRVEGGDVRGVIDAAVGLDVVRDLSVRVLDRSQWTPTVGAVDLAIDCVVCGNTVTPEGESARFDGTLYHFCCGSCLARFEERHDRLADGV